MNLNEKLKNYLTHEENDFLKVENSYNKKTSYLVGFEFASGSSIKYLFYNIQNMNFNTREINIFKGLILTELDLIVLRKFNQATNQKLLSQDIGISVGKVNYIINALVDKGFVKATRFVNSKNKIQYKYILTSDGIVEKVNLTKIFIERKKTEYEELQKELEILEETYK